MTWQAIIWQHHGAWGSTVSYCVGLDAQVVKRTMQTALVWTLYEELQPALKQALQKFSK